MNQIQSILISNIDRHPDARPVNAEAIAGLRDSIKALGLINPIRVRSRAEGRFQVVAGHHRLAACDLNGSREIDCIVVDDDDVRAEMATIAENLHRAELSKLERDEQVARWIELSALPADDDDYFEAFYAVVTEADREEKASNDKLSQPGPVSETVTDREAEQRVSSQLETKPQGGRPESGINAAARELGLKKADAHRAVKVAGLSPEAKSAARETGLDDNRTALLDAARNDTPEAQVKSLQDRKQGGVAGRVEEKTEPTYEQMRAAILLLADLAPEDINRICPPNRRAAMYQKLGHLMMVFEKVQEGASA